MNRNANFRRSFNTKTVKMIEIFTAMMASDCDASPRRPVTRKVIALERVRESSENDTDHALLIDEMVKTRKELQMGFHMCRKSNPIVY